jgi:hypothetical protein
MPYLVGHGKSTSKKEARANAARDFGAHLVRRGLIDASKLAQLSVVVYGRYASIYIFNIENIILHS